MLRKLGPDIQWVESYVAAAEWHRLRALVERLAVDRLEHDPEPVAGADLATVFAFMRPATRSRDAVNPELIDWPRHVGPAC